jgi:predicted RNA binding protein YcfA (HicA-like mRNA interferase family)
MKSVTGAELAKAIERNGWVYKRTTASHHIYGKSGNKNNISIPIHASKTLKTGLQAYLMRVAGITEQDL